MNNHDQLFVQLIYIFSQAALQGMGLLPNPASNKIEKDLTAAKQSIDMLETIKLKTKGNLSLDQSRLLDNTLTDLRLNYVDKMKEPAS